LFLSGSDDRSDEKIPRIDKIRQKMLKIWYNDLQKTGYSKGILSCMKKNAAGSKPFTLNKYEKEQLDPWEME
jgi:hypothetical protein